MTFKKGTIGTPLGGVVGSVNKESFI